MAGSSNRTIFARQVAGQNSLRNYIENASAHINTAGWATYADAAQSRPVDGTGGTPAVTWSRVTSSPLSLDASFQFVKDAVNRQGQGVSVDFSIDKADQAKIMEVSFSYELISGTYSNGTSSTDSDMIVYVYDVTNALMLEPQQFKIDAAVSGQVPQFKTTFQTSGNSTSYRLILHVASTSASAYTINFDNFRVSQQTVVYSSPVTDWQSYTPTYQGFGTVTTSNMRWRRNGDSVEIAGTFVTGTPTAVEARIGLPTGLQTDSSISTTEACGVLHRGAASTSNQTTLLVEPSVTYLTVGGITAAAQNPLTKLTGSGVAGGTETISISHTRVKIRGWSSNTLSSNDADQRVMAVRATKTSGSHTSTGSTQDVASWTTAYDTHSAFNATTGVFTAPVAGYYQISGLISFDGNATGTRIVEVQRNGTGTEAIWDREVASAAGNYLSGTATIRLNAGDTLRMRAFQDSGGSLAYVSTAGYNHVEIERVQGPSSITATEEISARYTGTPPTGTLTAAFNTTTFGTRDYDTHAAYSSGTYTIPVAGKYLITARVAITGTFSVNQLAAVAIFRNGTIVAQGDDFKAASQTSATPQVSDIVNCAAGDTITIRTYSEGSGLAFNSNSQQNRFAITRLGV